MPLIHACEWFAGEPSERVIKLAGKLPVTGELLRGSLLERTVRRTKDCPNAHAPVAMPGYEMAAVQGPLSARDPAVDWLVNNLLPAGRREWGAAA